MDRTAIVEWMTAQKLNNRQLADLLGISEDKVSKSLSATGKPRRWQGDEVGKLMRLMGSPADSIVRTEVRAANISDLDGFRATTPLKPLPLLGSGIGGDWDDLDNSIEMMELQISEVLDYLARPESLRNDSNAYALTVLGESMHPRFKPGWRIIVSPRAPVALGDDVVVQLCGAPDDQGQARVVRVLVKELVRRTADTLILRQWNPKRDFEVPANRVAHIHKIIGERY
jgi:phage repressor protein C with HTH and peptisase S24 domain